MERKKRLIKGLWGVLSLTLILYLSACVTVEDTRKKYPKVEYKEEEVYKTRFNLAYLYYDAGERTEVALSEVNKALEIRPGSAEAMALRGMIYDQMGKVNESLDSFRRAAALEPESQEYQQNVGVALCKHELYEEGIGYLSRASAMKGGSTQQSLIAMGACYLKAGQVSQGEGVFYQVLEEDPKNKDALYMLADSMYKRHDIYGARQYLDRLGGIKGLNAPALWLGVKITRQQGDAFLMSQYAKQLQERFPNSDEAMALRQGNYHQ